MNSLQLWTLLLLSLFPVFLWAFELSEVSEPPRTSSIFVGSVIQNGFPVQMKQFSSELNPVEVLSYYKQRWLDNRRSQGNVAKVIEKNVAEWQILSKKQGLYSVVIQVKKGAEGGAEGFISVLKLSQSQKMDPMIKQFPRLGGTEVFSSTESRDGGKHAITLVLKNSYSVDSNDAFYRAKMVAEGWTLVRNTIKREMVTLLFNNQDKQCEMAISSDGNGDTFIIANIVFSDF